MSDEEFKELLCEETHPHLQAVLDYEAEIARRRRERKRDCQDEARANALLCRLAAGRARRMLARRPVLRVIAPNARPRERQDATPRSYGSRRASGIRSSQDPGDPDLGDSAPARRNLLGGTASA